MFVWEANQYIRNISEGSCDIKDWSNDAKIHHHYTYIYIYIIHLNCNISQHCCFSCIFDHIRPPCVVCVTVRSDPVAVCALFCQCIYGHPGGPLFCKKIFAPILHHQQSPEFYEEVRRLPLNSTYLRLCVLMVKLLCCLCVWTLAFNVSSLR